MVLSSYKTLHLPELAQDSILTTTLNGGSIINPNNIIKYLSWEVSVISFDIIINFILA